MPLAPFSLSLSKACIALASRREGQSLDRLGTNGFSLGHSK